MKYASLYGRRVGVSGDGVAVPAWPEPVPGVPGRHVERVGPRAHRWLKRASSDELLGPVVEPLPSGSSFVEGYGGLETRLEQAGQLLSQLRTSSHPWAPHEIEQARKITLQRGGPPGWWFQPGGLVRSSRDDMREEFVAIRAILLRERPGDVPLPRYKRGTVHGFPDYGKTDLSLVLHALVARASLSSFEEVRSLLSACASIIGESDTPFSAATFSRTGPLGKDVPSYAVSGAGMVKDGTLSGVCCRRRVVQGIPSAVNMVQLPWAYAMKAAMQTVSSLWHYGPDDVAAKFSGGPGRQFWSDDISSFDLSVADEHQRALIDELIGPIAGEDAAQYKRQAKDIPLLGPAHMTGQEAFLYEKKGTTPSGDLMTAIDGGLVNMARVLRCMAAATGHTLKQVVAGLGHWWFCAIQGDDTALEVARPFSPQRYVDASEELGYVTKLAPGLVFLMHHIDPQLKRGIPLAARVFQQTVFNEYAGLHPALELSAFIARGSGAFMRNPWAPTVWRFLDGAEPFRRYRVTPATAPAAVLDPSFAVELRAAGTDKSRLRESHLRGLEAIAFGGWAPDITAALVRGLLTQTSAAMPGSLAPETARDAAMAIARHMSIPADDRPSTIANVPLAARAYVDSFET